MTTLISIILALLLGSTEPQTRTIEGGNQAPTGDQPEFVVLDENPT